MNQQEVHISSLVVHTRPENLTVVKDYIKNLPGTEIHAECPTGKLVVVLETCAQGYVTDVIDSINNRQQVLGTALVYHHIEQLDLPENESL